MTLFYTKYNIISVKRLENKLCKNNKTQFEGVIFMAKVEVTRKWLASNYTCCGVGYCDLQHLLRFKRKDFYTTGIYGWNFDAYTFGNYCITTGYRNMIHHVEAENINEYDSKAYAILNDSSLSYEEQENKVNALLKQFLEKTFKTDFSKYVFRTVKI